ncbi:uncharacterized protein [Macrobrachium rosenbergii]|uniref:uncharacterized protein n=1 Tax=Macrobrachium rosenbergii TaxID=79674 RepID=UPI0034D4AA0E
MLWPLLLLFFTSVSRGSEIAEECSENEMILQCPPESGEIAISEAWLYGESAKPLATDYAYEDDRCRVREPMIQYKKGSILQYINKQCGGLSNCSFSVWDHVPGADANQDIWQKGVLRAVYHCKKKSEFYRTCGTELWAQSGWIQNVGYPEYYLGDEGPCTITISVDEGQHIQLTITDLSIRDMSQPIEESCKDSLTVFEGSKQLLNRCGEINQPLTIVSEGSSLNITLNASTKLFPKRGYLAHFQALGCESPEMPQDGYRAFRNATYAEYWCCIHHVFPDTLLRRRVLKCNRAHSWNDTLPDCVDLEELLNTGNITETQYLSLSNGTTSTAHAEMFQQAHFVYDLIVPTVIMTVLVLGNVAIVILIIYCRRGIIEDNAHSEELESIKANPEPTDVLDTAPCSV